jgi:hypothetical protein
MGFRRRWRVAFTWFRPGTRQAARRPADEIAVEAIGISITSTPGLGGGILDAARCTGHC